MYFFKFMTKILHRYFTPIKKLWAIFTWSRLHLCTFLHYTYAQFCLFTREIQIDTLSRNSKKLILQSSPPSASSMPYNLMGKHKKGKCIFMILQLHCPQFSYFFYLPIQSMIEPAMQCWVIWRSCENKIMKCTFNTCMQCL